MCKKYAKYVFIETYIGDYVVEQDMCAASEPLITHGKDADPREYPHMVSMENIYVGLDTLFKSRL